MSQANSAKIEERLRAARALNAHELDEKRADRAKATQQEEFFRLCCQDMGRQAADLYVRQQKEKHGSK